MREEQKGQTVERYNLQDTSNVLQIRLNADFVLKRVKQFLTGVIETVVYDEDGKPFIKEEQIAQKKANDEGIQAILNFVENIINPQAVQGNLTFDQYQNYISEVHENLYTDLIENLYNWEIKEDNYEVICDWIMVLIIPFISRLIDNKERDSYAASIKSIDTNVVNRGKEGLFH